MSKSPQATHETAQRAFRDAPGITVVETRTSDGQIGMTVSSFISGSLDPPLVVLIMARQPSKASIFETREYYSINVLSADQQHLSQRFASRGNNKSAGLETDEVRYVSHCCVDAAIRYDIRAEIISYSSRKSYASTTNRERR